MCSVKTRSFICIIIKITLKDRVKINTGAALFYNMAIRQGMQGARIFGEVAEDGRLGN